MLSEPTLPPSDSLNSVFHLSCMPCCVSRLSAYTITGVAAMETAQWDAAAAAFAGALSALSAEPPSASRSQRCAVAAQYLAAVMLLKVAGADSTPKGAKLYRWVSEWVGLTPPRCLCSCVSCCCYQALLGCAHRNSQARRTVRTGLCFLFQMLVLCSFQGGGPGRHHQKTCRLHSWIASCLLATIRTRHMLLLLTALCPAGMLLA
jgi:hypothetical protein